MRKGQRGGKKCRQKAALSSPNKVVLSGKEVVGGKNCHRNVQHRHWNGPIESDNEEAIGDSCDPVSMGT